MAQISPLLQYILSRPRFEGPPVNPVFDVKRPFNQPEQAVEIKDRLMAGDYPEWLSTYLGGGDPVRGQAIMDYAVRGD